MHKVERKLNATGAVFVAYRNGEVGKNSFGCNLAILRIELPAYFGRVDDLSAEIGNFDPGVQYIGVFKGELLEAHQGNDFIAKGAELGGADVAFFVPEGVEHAHQGGALTRKVVQTQELEAGQVGGAQGGFNFLFVAGGLQFP